MEIIGQITADEISKSVKDLKIEKTCYDDNIINEYIKSSAHLLIPIYFKSFICILVPGTWLSGNSIPIFKNKGKSSDPKYFRLISILSCLRKLSFK
jgi:ferritin-like protein